MTIATPRHLLRNAALVAFAIVAFGSAAGCVYRIDIQQGNFLEAKDIDRVAVGMTRIQVRALLGTPMVADPFESWRWDYVYYLKKGRWKRPDQRHFIVFFEDDKVTRIDRSGQGADSQGTQKKADRSDQAVEKQVVEEQADGSAADAAPKLRT